MRHYRFDDAAVVLAGAHAARRYFEPYFLGRKQELMIVALCDAQCRLCELLSFPGGTGSTQISLREVFQSAPHHNAMIVAHNHPSGDPRPSEADLKLTRKLAQLCEAVDVALLDHLIFAGGEMFGFRQAGLI